MFRGEKTVAFWIGLVVFGYSIYQFCIAGWYILYFTFIFPKTIIISPYPTALTSEIPPIIGGIIFMVIGLYVMKVGIRKGNSQTQSQLFQILM